MSRPPSASTTTSTIGGRSFTNVVWTFDTFKYNFGIHHRFTEYLKGNCGLGSDEHYTFKYCTKNALITKIFLEIVRALLAALGMKGLSAILVHTKLKVPGGVVVSLSRSNIIQTTQVLGGFLLTLCCWWLILMQKR